MAPPGVLIPAFNESRGIAATLDALARQTCHEFQLVVVDNASTDDTADVVRRFATSAPFPVTVLAEPQKGVGCAADTGARWLISQGAPWFARTDADCLPRPEWFAHARDAIKDADLVCGAITARRDENGLPARLLFAAQVRLAAWFGQWRPSNRGPQFLTPYRMHAGNNMAVRAETYLASGGWLRRGAPTDRQFLNAMRATTPRIVQCRGMVSENSTRRLKAMGVVQTARWYLGQGAGGKEEDPR